MVLGSNVLKYCYLIIHYFSVIAYLCIQAAVQGAGCWADGTVGVVTTGCGEHLIATNLAKEAARNIHSSNCPTLALQTTFKDGFLGTVTYILVLRVNLLVLTT